MLSSVEVLPREPKLIAAMESRDKPNLDLMRSFAVLAVVFDHTWLAAVGSAHGYTLVTSIGFFGVCLFFVHTTLVLMWSLERQSSPFKFYVRRVFRIYPLAILFVASIALFNVFASRGVFAPFLLPAHSSGVVVSAWGPSLHCGSCLRRLPGCCCLTAWT